MVERRNIVFGLKLLYNQNICKKTELGWTKSDHCRNKQFVVFCFAEINESTESKLWRYVLNAQNVADDQIRGIVETFFLYRDEIEWHVDILKNSATDVEIHPHNVAP